MRKKQNEKIDLTKWKMFCRIKPMKKPKGEKLSKIEKNEIERAKFRNETLGVCPIPSKKVRGYMKPRHRVRTSKMVVSKLSPKELYKLKSHVDRLIKNREEINPLYRINFR